MTNHFARVHSAQPQNLVGKIITVEVDISRGLHAFSIVGLADKAVEESRDRVGSALRHADVSSPKHHNEKTIVSLAPANTKKQGVYFDLAIAIGYLVAKGELPLQPTDGVVFVGELSLNGELRPVPGIIILALAAQKAGFQTIIVPEANLAEAQLLPNISALGAKTLVEVIGFIKDPKQMPLTSSSTQPTKTPALIEYLCFSEVKGQDSTKRALQIAAAGGHNVLLYGPPGTGKSMLAKAFTGILPPLTDKESLAVTSIHSLSGQTISRLVRQRPFESPHHTSSHTAILGGGANPKPGSITMAHHGVLFMDEFPEFDRRVLEGLRQPLEDRVVHIARAQGKASFPASIILLAAMNPPDPNATPADIRRLERKLSGPIMDRIDLWSAVEHVDYQSLSDISPSGQTSAAIQEQVLLARERQYQRKETMGEHWPATNSELQGKHIDQLAIDPGALSLLQNHASKLHLSPRSYHRVIKAAQTIADLSADSEITTEHMLEALSYRNKKDAATTPYQTSI